MVEYSANACVYVSEDYMDSVERITLIIMKLSCIYVNKLLRFKT